MRFQLLVPLFWVINGLNHSLSVFLWSRITSLVSLELQWSYSSLLSLHWEYSLELLCPRTLHSIKSERLRDKREKRKNRSHYSCLILIIFFSSFFLSRWRISETIPTIFNALALGSFFYIGATELVGDEFRETAKVQIRWLKFLGLVCGAAVLCIVRIFVEHDH